MPFCGKSDIKEKAPLVRAKAVTNVVASRAISTNGAGVNKASSSNNFHSHKPLLGEVMLAFQVIPRVREGCNFEVVDRAIEVVKASGVVYQVSAMETTMKGELNNLLEIVKAAQQACYDAGAVEVITNVKIHSTTEEAKRDTFRTYDRGVTKSNHMFVESNKSASVNLF